MNYYLDRNQILRIASNPDVYNRGLKYYNDGRVEKTDFFNSSNVYTVSGRIKGNMKYYSATANFDNNGILKSHNCSCDANGIWRGACKHIVALLLKIFEMNQKKAIFSRDLRAAKNMLDFFEKQAFDEVDIILNETSNQDNKVTVSPTLNMDDRCNLFLTFTIGRERRYIIKSVSEFIRNIIAENTVYYGKNLEFKHKLSLFDKQSMELIDIIMKEYDNNGLSAAKSNNNYFYYPNAFINKILFLSSRVLDSFFDIYENQEVKFKASNMDDGFVFFINKDPDVKFDLNISDRNECLELTANMSKMIGLKGENYNYILHDNFFYRTNEKFYDTLKPILKAYSTVEQNSILISKQEISRFMTFLYPRLKENNLLGENANIYELDVEYCPLVKKIYFDVAEKTSITCKVLFCYGENEINPLKDDGSKEGRNILEEYKLIQKLTLFGFVANQEEQCYILRDENLIYDFYYADDGLDLIKEQNETYATNEFMNKSVKQKINTSFGIRLNGNLLEVSIDAKDYNAKELMDIINSYSLKKRYHRLKDGTFLNLDGRNENLESAIKLISGLDISDKELKKGTVSVPKYRVLYLDSIINNSKDTDIKIDDSFENVVSDFRLYKELQFNIPETLESILRPYQKEGFNWLKVISHYSFGGILADDMGLGKTLQIISVLLSEKGSIKSPSIVVAPTSLIYNWEKEINKFAPSLKALTIAGNSSKRKETLDNAGGFDVYITTYDMLKRDIENYEGIEFEYVIADEAQNIKNPSTQNAKALKTLKGRVRFALTGTPIENSLLELWSIFDFIMPGYLYNNSKFVKKYEGPIIKDNDERIAEELRRQIAPFILRRVKRDVLQELPEKIETTLYADMTAEQHKIYTAHLMKAKGVLDDNIKKGVFNKKRIDMLAQLTRLRQICCHPAVFIENYKGGSGKLDLTIDTITSYLDSGHRILIFSQFTSMLSIIQDKLKKQNILYFYLDGATDSKQRLIMADRFNNGEREIFLISLKAGGTGLNLTGADVVIHFDPWWNPAVMDQASDRAHRFGQNRTVQVINIVAKNSVEEKIMQLQSKKKDLVDTVIKEGSNFINRMSEEDVIQLFKE